MSIITPQQKDATHCIRKSLENEILVKCRLLPIFIVWKNLSWVFSLTRISVPLSTTSSRQEVMSFILTFLFCSISPVSSQTPSFPSAISHTVYTLYPSKRVRKSVAIVYIHSSLMTLNANFLLLTDEINYNFILNSM